jgi:6-phosphogluconolactonase
MLKAIRGLLTIALSAGAITSTMYAAENVAGSSSTVFVMTNDTVKNELLAYKRQRDGSFALRGSFATGGRGSGGTTDPLQSQGSLTLSGNQRR